MSVGIEIKPRTSEIILSLEKGLIDTHKKGLRKALSLIGQEVKTEAKKLITTGARTGRVWNLRGPYAFIRSSAPGEPPANMSGTLERSVFKKTRNHREMTIGAKAPYAIWLEEGTRNMAPRPFLITAVRNKEKDAVRIIEETVKREIGG